MCWVYVIWSEKFRKRYVGSMAKTPEDRLVEHNSKKTPFTAKGIPWILVYEEHYPSLGEGKKREVFLKSGVGRKWLDDHISMPHDYSKSNRGF
ncbi:MAG: GIY-YIG nuclease family protein [Candidatus Kryptoniota bacterium]